MTNVSNQFLSPDVFIQKKRIRLYQNDRNNFSDIQVGKMYKLNSASQICIKIAAKHLFELFCWNTEFFLEWTRSTLECSGLCVNKMSFINEGPWSAIFRGIIWRKKPTNQCWIDLNDLQNRSDTCERNLSKSFRWFTNFSRNVVMKKAFRISLSIIKIFKFHFMCEWSLKLIKF